MVVARGGAKWEMIPGFMQYDILRKEKKWFVWGFDFLHSGGG